MVKYRILALLVIARIIGLSISQCQNGGVNILVRKKQIPHAIGYSCLCPYTFYGQSCQNFRNIYCRFSNQKVLNYNPLQSPMSTLQFDFNCYLLKLSQNATQQSKQQNNFHKLPLTPSLIHQQLQTLNYYIDNQYQIIWANDSSLFDSNGMLIRNSGDVRTQEEILGSYARFQFQYEKDFYGVPLGGVDVGFNLTVVSFQRNSVSLPQPVIKFQQVPQQNFGKVDYKYVGEFALEIKKQWQEYGVVRLELLATMWYGQLDTKLSHRLGMNSAKWRIFNPKITKGTILQPTTTKIPSSFWVILAFIGLFCLIYGGRLLIKLYKEYRSRKNMKQIEADDDDGREG